MLHCWLLHCWRLLVGLLAAGEVHSRQPTTMDAYALTVLISGGTHTTDLLDRPCGGRRRGRKWHQRQASC